MTSLKYGQFLFASLLIFLATNTHAKETITAGLHYAPPWAYLDKQDQIVGIEKELIESAFESQGYQVRFEVFGYSRLLIEIKSHHLDFASPVAIQIPGVVYTTKYIPISDVAISLSDQNLDIQHIADLKGKRVIAYQQASNVLGEEYRQVTRSKSVQYDEFLYRENHLFMLFNNRVDVVVGDQRVLEYLTGTLYDIKKIQIHKIFPAMKFGGAARNEEIKNVFETGLKELQESGEYQRILNKKRY